MPDPDVRRQFLDERRAICRDRFDTIHAHDDRWGSYLNPSHERCLRDLVAYPDVEKATTLLHEAGFHVDEVLEGDGYAHLLLST